MPPIAASNVVKVAADLRMLINSKIVLWIYHRMPHPNTNMAEIELTLLYLEPRMPHLNTNMPEIELTLSYLEPRMPGIGPRMLHPGLNMPEVGLTLPHIESDLPGPGNKCRGSSMKIYSLKDLTRLFPGLGCL